MTEKKLNEADPRQQGRASRPLISICIPVYNEQDNITLLCERLRAMAGQFQDKYQFEFLCADDGSTDRSYELLIQCAHQDQRIRIIRFSRNFGFQRSVLVGFLNARGEAAIEMDADLQDPPEMVGEFLALWEKGYKVVYGVRTHRDEGRLITVLRTAAYRLISNISDAPVPVNAGDFRLIDRVIIEHLRELKDRNPYLRGAIAALGYPQIGIKYKRPQRHAGSSKFPFVKLMKLGLDGITGLSTKPLRYITMTGLALSLITGLLCLVYLIAWLFQIGTEIRGFTTLVLLQLFAISMNAMFLGMMGEYIGRIFDNVRGHPIAIIEKTFENGHEIAYGDSKSPIKLDERV